MKKAFLFILLCGCLSLSGTLKAAEGQLMAGTAKINITPKQNIPLHDSVYARALVMEIGNMRVAQVSVDLVNFYSDRVANICKEKYGITQLLICASHTHEDPNMADARPREKKPDNTPFFEECIIKVVGEAVGNMFPARISAGTRTFPQLGFNRLIIRKDGKARESWVGDEHYNVENPERIPFGPVDPEVGVIKVEDMQGNARAIVMSYAMHADLGCFSYEISADYPGFACKKVEEAFDNKAICLFVAGGGGNVEGLMISRRRSGPDDPIKTDYKPIQRTGELLGIEVIKLANALHASSDNTSFKMRTDSLQFSTRGDKNRKVNVHIATFLINDFAIAVCPGEMFVQLQLEWKAKARLADVTPLFFGYTYVKGRSPGYVADVRSAALGGFGAEGGNRIQVGGGEAIINKHLENLYILNNQRASIFFK